MRFTLCFASISTVIAIGVEDTAPTVVGVDIAVGNVGDDVFDSICAFNCQLVWGTL